MKLRSIRQVYEHYKKTDPDSRISAAFIRKRVASGEIPVIRNGRKALIDLDWFDEYLRRKTSGTE